MPVKCVWGSTRPMTSNWQPAVGFRGLKIVTEAKDTHAREYDTAGQLWGVSAEEFNEQAVEYGARWAFHPHVMQLIQRIAEDDPDVETLVCNGRNGSDPDIPEADSAVFNKLGWRLGATSGTGTYLQELASAMQRNQSVTELKLQGCAISTQGIATLAAALPPQLQMLSLEQNQLDDSSAKLLGAALQEHRKWQLRLLDLTDNAITDTGVAALVTGLERCAGLAELSLSANQVDDVGTTVLCHTLQGLRGFRALDLSENCIGNAGIQAITDLVHANQSTREIDLSMNAITEVGMHQLKQVLDQCSHEIKINLAYNIVVTSAYDSEDSQLPQLSMSRLGMHQGAVARYSREKSRGSQRGKSGGDTFNLGGTLGSDLMDGFGTRRLPGLHEEEEDDDSPHHSTNKGLDGFVDTLESLHSKVCQEPGLP